jgi:hypothetical protein
VGDWKDGFLSYTGKHVKKANAIRIAQSRPDLAGVPILQEGSVLFSSGDSAHDEPRSCYNCPFFNFESSCKLMDARIKIKKFTTPERMEAGAKPIEYWPVCGYWIYGQPNYGLDEHYATLDPSSAGLGWVNAPKTGQELSGTSCGGACGGDDCDLWITKGDDKRAEATGFCRVLQKETGNMDCCSAWQDDDWLTWEMVQERFREKL